MMSWISEVPWEQPTKVASLAIANVREWYSSHPFGQYVLVILVVFWIGHIVSQLVFSSDEKGANLQMPQDPTKPPMIFHLFPWVGSMVIYGMEPYKFFINAREKVTLTRRQRINRSMEIISRLFLADGECMLP